MKARSSPVWVAGILLCGSLVSVGNPAKSDTATDEARVLSLESAWNQAFAQKDTRALGMLFADTFSYIDYDGSIMNKTQYLASAQSRWVMPTRILNESVAAHIYGQTAVVTGVYRETGTKGGKPYLLRERFTDTWIRLGNSWQCVASQSTLIEQ